MDEEAARPSLETRVTVLETMYRLMHADFKELRTTIMNTAMGIVSCIVVMMFGAIVYFGQQKDQALTEIERIVQQHEIERRSNVR